MSSVTAPKAIERRLAQSNNALLLAVCLAQFMVILDVAIVNVALPSMRTGLHFSTSGLQWVVNAYTLTFAGFLMLGGRSADLLGDVTEVRLEVGCDRGEQRAGRRLADNERGTQERGGSVGCKRDIKAVQSEAEPVPARLDERLLPSPAGEKGARLELRG